MEINKNFDILKSCRFCPMCRHVCASGNISQAESDFPRGRAMILYGIHKGSMQYDEDLAEALYNCFLCGCCWNHCESHYDLPRLIQASRVDMVDQDAAPALAYEIRDAMLAYGNPYGVQDKRPYETKGKVKEGASHLYYMGFDVNYFNHEIADAAVKVFESLGLDYTLLEKEPDCGKVFSLLGFSKESADAAKRLYDRIKKAGPSRIIVSDPLSYDCLKNDFKGFGLDLGPEIEVLHFSEWIADQAAKIKFKGSHGPITLIDSEYLGRFNHVFEQPRKVLRQIAGDAFFELMENEEMQLASGEAAFMFRGERSGAARVLANKICDMAKEKDVSVLVTLAPSTKNAIGKNTDCRAVSFEEMVFKNI